MTIVDKPWGLCKPLAQMHSVQIDRINVNAEGYSSLHFHELKTNLFFVDSGLMHVHVLQGEVLETHELNPGDAYQVEPGILHQFYCPEATIAYEFYWQRPKSHPIDRDDIVRVIPNGCHNYTLPTWRTIQHGLRKAGRSPESYRAYESQ